MTSISVVAELDSPPALLWPLVLDFERQGEWLTGHERFTTEPPAALREGATFVQRGTLKGVSGAVEWTIRTLRRNRLLELSGDAPMGLRVTARFELAPEESGSRVTCRYEVHGPPMAGLLVRAGRGTAHRHTKASLARLDALAGASRLPQIA